ncbi:hypothetical protein TVAG_058480 [Trichomonas vaginalis G3]|uniref:Viral A-type inclusion protein n=1 Tax=Trichomonas vaginalis (strain ATCC PRA-98 / G3) TaxID=412133 RepID=A2EQA8_TRIV3|nr:A-type inclusion protein-related family [Trichomonas vaginalis G3]EAY05191.1 hypothetical protein TVAG_058480 [Trichomonas vaginalis G3]KAI5522961.1 A-type inclusion protein-related family [Trichomonas vaginalis G3]|eukprot:XP_001317414.1 hypothetical protein [Trichomonas vaginalis G3]
MESKQPKLVQKNDSTESEGQVEVAAASRQEIENLKRDNKDLLNQLSNLQAKYDELLKSTNVFTDTSSLKNVNGDNDSNNNLPPNQTNNSSGENNHLYEHLLSLLANHESNEKQDSSSDSFTKGGDNRLSAKYNTVINELLEVQKQNDELLNENVELEKENDQLRNQLATATSDLKESEKIIKGLNAQLSSLRRELDARIGDNEKADHRLLVTDTEKQVVQMQYEELQNQAVKRKIKINGLKKLNEKLQEDNKSISKKNATLNMEYQKLQFAYEELNRQYEINLSDKTNEEALQTKEKQIQKLQKALDDMTSHLESTCSDLTSENERRTQMQSVLQKQNQLLSLLEQKVTTFSEENSNLKSQIESLKQENSDLNPFKTTRQCPHKEVSIALLNYIKSELPETNLSIELENILCQSELDTTEKVVTAFSTLLNSSLCSNAFTIKMDQYNSDMTELKTQNNRLVNYIANMVQFIDHVANSGDIQEWLIGHVQPEDFRNSLNSQVARIQSYLQSNKLLNENEDLCDSFAHFPTYINKKLAKEDVYKSNDNELLCLLQMFSLANDILTKFSVELQNRSSLLMAELRRTRDEFAESEQSTKDEIELKTQEIEIEKQNLIEENEILQRKIENAKEELRKSEVSNSLAILQLLNDDLDNSEVVPSNDEYTQQIEQKLYQKQEEMKKKDEENQKEKENLMNQINDLKKKLGDLSTEKRNLNEKMEKEKDIFEEEIENLKEDNETIKNLNDKYVEEINKLKELVAEELEHNKQLIEAHEKAMNDLQNDIEEKHQKELMQVGDEIDKLHNLITKKEEENTEALKQVKNQFRDEINKLKNEKEEAEKHSEEITENYENLCENYKQKMEEARENESKAREEMIRVQTTNKSLNDELSEIRVDFKMLAMKYKSLEEKSKREKQQIEAKMQMVNMANEAAMKKKVGEAEIVARESFKNFLISVCEKFTSFVDFSKQIDENSVNELLDKVSLEVESKSANGMNFTRQISEYKDAKALLGIKDEESLVNNLQKLVEKCRDYENMKTSIESEHSEVKDLLNKVSKQSQSASEAQDWLEWAVNLHGIISDSFSLVKKPSELRFAIGEAVMSSLGKKRLWRHMEILRSEKQIFVNGLDRQKVVIPRTTITTLTAVLVSIRRIQKMSGHLFSPISIPRNNEETQILSLTPRRGKVMESNSPKKNWPLLIPK